MKSLGLNILGAELGVEVPRLVSLPRPLEPALLLTLQREGRRSGRCWFRLSQNVLNDVKPHRLLLPSLSAYAYVTFSFSRLNHGMQAPNGPRCFKPAIIVVCLQCITIG